MFCRRREAAGRDRQALAHVEAQPPRLNKRDGNNNNKNNNNNDNDNSNNNDVYY